MESLTIRKNAGIEMDRRAREYMQTHKTDYRTALYTVSRGDVARQYAYGETTVKRYDELTATQKAMNELLGDPEKTRRLAGDLLDVLVRGKLVNLGQGSPPYPADAYRRALGECKKKYPNLGRAASDGFIADDDFALLGMLIPSVGAEVEKGNYRQCVLDARRYGTELDAIACYF